MLSTGMFIDNDLSIRLETAGLNHQVPRGVGVSTKLNPDIRFITISKSLDWVNFADSEFEKLNNNLINILGEDFTKYKFVLLFELQESLLTKDRINFFKKLLRGSKCLFVTVNLEECIPNEVVYLNNPPWTLCDVDNPEFFKFWKYIKLEDLGTIKKKFMFLNNHYSEIRLDILKFIYKRNKQNDGNISFNIIDFKQLNIDEDNFFKTINHYGIEYPKTYDAIPTLTQLSDKEISRKSIVGINHATTMHSFNYRIYLESFFEIITETQFHIPMPGVHISEKIHKPLRTALPFMYYGNPKLKGLLENIGMTFNSPIYFFGMDVEFFNHLDFLLNKDLEWYNTVQNEYINEYFNNMDKWIEFIKNNNKQILKFIFL